MTRQLNIYRQAREHNESLHRRYAGQVTSRGGSPESPTRLFQDAERIRMKLNPVKCNFGVISGDFLGYIVTQQGIEANPKQTL